MTTYLTNIPIISGMTELPGHTMGMRLH